MAEEPFKIPVEVNFSTTGAGEAKKAVQDLSPESLPGISADAQTKADVQYIRAQDEKVRANNRVSAAGLNMGSTMQNVGYQVQDFAVQVGSGTSAVRAFGQQAPQLLSAFGPWGVALGTLAAVGGPIAGQLLAQAGAAGTLADASNKLATDTKDATEETIKMARAQALARSEMQAAEDRIRAYAQTLRDITRDGYEYNDVVREQIGLLRQQQDATNQVEDAKGQRRIEEAAGDPVKQEQVRNQVRKDAQTRELTQMRDEALVKEDLIKRLQDQSVSVQVRAENEAAAKKALADQKGAEALQLEQTKITKEAEEKSLRESAATTKKADVKGALNRQADAAKKEAADADEAAKKLRSEEGDFRKQGTDLEDTGRKSAGDIQGEINKLYKEIQGLSLKFDTSKQVFAERDAAGSTREGRAKAEAWQRQENETADALRLADQAALTAKRNQLDSTSKGNATKFRNAGKNVGGGLGEALGSIGEDLANGTDAAEMQEIRDAFEAATKGLGGKTIEIMRSMLAAQEEQAKQLAIMEQKLKNK